MINESYLQHLAKIESGNNPLAKNPVSSAKGKYQFIDSTAKQYGITAQFGTPEYTMQEEKAIIDFSNANYNALKNGLGRDPSYGELYLAHQQGAEGAKKILSQPDALAIDVVGRDAVINNGGNETMTAAEFAQKWTSKFDQVDAQNKPAKTVNIYDLFDVKNGEVSSKEITSQKKQINLYDIIQSQENTDEFKQSPSGDVMIDKQTGAAQYVRAVAGSIYDQQDKLNTIKKYYPDAKPYGEDNFIFTHPETGNPTLYNPDTRLKIPLIGDVPVPDLGDIASISREVYQTAGSSVGAIGGAVLGSFLGPAGTASGAITGAGVGGSAAGSAFDEMLNSFGVRVDTRTTEEKVYGAAGEAAVMAAGEGIGRALPYIGYGVKRAFGGGKASTAAAYDQLIKSGIKNPSLSLIAEGGFLNAGSIEMGLQQNPAAASIMIKNADEIVNTVSQAMDDIVARIGKPLTKEGASDVIRGAAENAAEVFKTQKEAIYTPIFDQIGPDTLVNVKNAAALLDDLKIEAAQAPKTLGAVYKETINYLNGVVSDASGGGIPFKALRTIRTSLGRDLEANAFVGGNSSSNAALRRAYGAITLDISDTAKNTSPELAKQLSSADDYVRSFMQTQAKLLTKIDKLNGDGAAYNFIMNSAKDGGASLKTLRGEFTAEEWDSIAATVLDRLGKATAGAQDATGQVFSTKTLMTNWNKLSPEGKDALFGGSRYKSQREALDALMETVTKINQSKRFLNSSNTGNALQTTFLLNGLFGLGAGVATGATGGDSLTTSGATIAGAFLGPKAIAKLMTNKAFVQWISEPVKDIAAPQVGSLSKNLTEHLGRLVYIAETNPDIREEVKQYMQNLKAKASEQ